MSSNQPKRFTSEQAIAMLTAIRAEDSDGESEIKEDEVSDWELSTSDEEDDDSEDDETADNSEPSTSGNAVSLVHSSRDQTTDSLNVPGTLGIQEIARDGTKWDMINFGVEDRGRRAAQNVLTELSGLSKRSRQMADSPLGAFELIFDNYIFSHIQNCTNVEACRVLENSTWHVSKSELRAFIALLYVRGAYGGRNVPLDSFWNKQWGVRFFPETMARNRFREILRFLRFDLRSTRSTRLQTDKFALVSEVWNRFVDNSMSLYKPGVNITIDEQLFPTKARCRFTQYMPNKPDKFGIKFWLAVDVQTKYILNAIPYLGKDESRATSERLSDWVVMSLTEPFLGKGRNVTTDNFFTSLKLAYDLKQKNQHCGNRQQSKKRVATVRKSYAEQSVLQFTHEDC